MVHLAMTCHLHQRIRTNSQRQWSHYSARPAHTLLILIHHCPGCPTRPIIYHESVSLPPWQCPLSLLDYFQLNTTDVHLHPGLHLNYILLRIVPVSAYADGFLQVNDGPCEGSFCLLFKVKNK